MHDMNTPTVSVNHMLNPHDINEETGDTNFPTGATGIAWTGEVVSTECSKHLLDPSWRSAMGGHASDEPEGVVLFGPVTCDVCQEFEADVAAGLIDRPVEYTA